jgi:hypothetical protein
LHIQTSLLMQDNQILSGLLPIVINLVDLEKEC